MFNLKQNKGVAKQIKCSYCQCPVRDAFDNLYACKWKVDGSGVKLPATSKIKIFNVDNSENNEETDTPNIRERQTLALKDYNAKLKVTKEKYRAFMNKNRLQENTSEKNVKLLELEMHLINMAILILI